MSDREFTRVLAAEGISNFGAMLSRLAIPWLAMLTLDAKPSQSAAMLLCDALRAGVLALLAWGAWRGGLTFTLLLVAAAAGGVMTVGFELARSAWMSQRAGLGDLSERNAQLSVAGSVSEAVAFSGCGWRSGASGRLHAGAVAPVHPGPSSLTMHRACVPRPGALVGALLYNEGVTR